MSCQRRMLGGFLSAIALVAAASALSAQSGPVAGRNVNIVGGPATLTLTPFDLVGDPFGAQQNEGSCAFSPRSLHILCGANDYRAIDLPGIDEEKIPGDAFAGVFQSRDGGLTWESRLHPGFMLDSTDSVIKPFPAIADSVVRIGPAGLGFYSGIAFERTEDRLGLLFVSTWMDLLAREGDPAPFKHVRTVMVDGGHAGKFIDKPWMALGTPIPGQTCTLDVPVGDGTTVRQTVPRTPIHLAWAVFPASSDDTTSAKIYYSRSTNCGVSFSRPVDLSGGSILNQGVQVTVVPFTDDVYVSWRRGATGNQGDALMVRRSGNGGGTFSAPVAVASRRPSGLAPAQGFHYCPFDQGTSPYTFRTTGFPTMAAGAGRAFMFWSQRQGDCSSGTARIVMSSTTNGTNWKAPVTVDSPPVPGHQIMPTATVAGSTLQVAWFDFRSDASGLFGSAIEEFSIVDPNTVLPPSAANPRRRHTVDVRGAQASLGILAPASLTFSPYPVSQYLFGIPSGINPATNMPFERQQLQYSPVNVRMFKKMTVPFISDYLDFAAPQYAPAHPVYLPGIWAPNAGQHGDTPSMVAWTDQRNVKLFPGEQYIDSQGNPVPRPFTRKTLPGQGGRSLVDPDITVPACIPNANDLYTGTKNQDVFVAPVYARGWFAAAAWNNKPLGFATTPLPDGTLPLLQRGFAVFARNITAEPKEFRVRIGNQPSGGRASFDQFTLQTQIQISVPARSMVARTVFVEAPSKRAAVAVDFTEIVDGTFGPGFMRVWLNPDPSAPESLLLPDSVLPTEPELDITNFEVYDIAIGEPSVRQGSLTPGLNNTQWENPEWENPEWENPEWENPEWENPEWENPEWENPEWENPEWENPEWENAAPDNQIKQFRWRVENTGNTTTAYSSKVAIVGETGATAEFQLVVYKVYTTPATNTCEANRLIGHTQVLSNVTNLDVSLTNFQNSDWENSSAAHYSLEPGEVAYVALQVVGTADALEDLTTDDTVMGIQPQGVDTIDKLAGVTEPEVAASVLTIVPPVSLVPPASLPPGTAGEPYPATQFSAIGGTAPYAWSSPEGEQSLPPGLTLNRETGVLSGTPTQGGTFTFDVTVTDFSTPTQTATRTLTLSITGNSANLSFETQPSDSVAGQPMSDVIVVAQDDSGATLPGVPVTLVLGSNPSGAALSGGTATTNSDGRAVFSNLVVDRAGEGYTLVASAEGAADATSTTFNVAPAVDLVVETLTHSPLNPTTVDVITFSATVKNLGPGTAQASTLMFKVGGEPAGGEGTLFPVPSLESGATYTVQRQRMLPAQDYVNTATADWAGAVNESNEANNTTTDSYTVAPVPDLLIEQMTHSPENPSPSDDMTFTAVVKNGGVAAAGASKLLFTIGGETPGAPETVFDVPALSVGQSFTVTRTATLDVSQRYTNNAVADYTKVVTESDEANNTRSDTFDVTYTADHFAPGHILVAHRLGLTDDTTAISELGPSGNFLRRFGTSNDDARTHLALGAGALFRSNGLSGASVSQFNGSGALVRTIIPNSSTNHRIVPTASDFQDQSIYFVDIDAGTNVVRHLDTPSTGQSSSFVGLSYSGVAGISDLALGGPAGNRALFALTQTSPEIAPPGLSRVAKITPTGAIQFFDSSELTVPYVFDVGSVAVDSSSGNVYVATTTKIVIFNAAGTQIGSFAASDGKPSLDVAANGNIYMGRFTNGEISVFDPSGELLSTIKVLGASRIIDILIVPPGR